MSTVGKVLVVAQVAFSLLLMAFAGGVSSQQLNWKTKTDEATRKLTKTNSDLDASRKEVQSVRDQMAASEKTLKNARDKAQGEADAARDRGKQLETQLTQRSTELENMRAEAKIAGEEARARRDEAVAMRDLNTQLHQKRDELITESRKQADRIVSLEQEQRGMVDKHRQLLDQFAILQRFIRVKGFDADPKELVGLTEPPPVIPKAMVLNTKKGGRSTPELVEISLGSDAGLAKGHELFVYRSGGKGKYLGKIRLELVDYRTAVGVVVESTSHGEIQRGDNVTSKL